MPEGALKLTTRPDIKKLAHAFRIKNTLKNIIMKKLLSVIVIGSFLTSCTKSVTPPPQKEEAKVVYIFVQSVDNDNVTASSNVSVVKL